MNVSDEAMRWAGALFLWSVCAFGSGPRRDGAVHSMKVKP